MVWEDSPSHVCRGGDKSALSFCCPPVKPCPVIYALEDAKLTPQEYIEIKEKILEKKLNSAREKEPVLAHLSGAVNLQNHVH